ncbi:MAG: universal stress protein [Gaiellaceae bacterium]
METIVVGVDCSEGSKRVLGWAAAQARKTGARLRPVHAWERPLGLSSIVSGQESMDELERDARARLDSVLAEASEELEGLDVQGEAREGDAAEELVDAAKDADLLVVGSHGHSSVLGLLLGSVAMEIAQHAPCPLVIVPTR